MVSVPEAKHALYGDSPEMAAQQAARDAVMEVPIFPDLERELIKAFGANSAIVLHQLVYWFSKPKMQKRRWLYKTFKEWRDERGLGRKAVDSARRRLAKIGVLEEKYGPNKRVHYRVDWVRLAETMNLDFNPDAYGVPIDDDLDDFDLPEESLHPKGDSDSDEDDILGGESLTPKGDSESLHPKGDSSHCTLKGTVVIDPLGGQSNTGDYARDYSLDYLTRETPLQGAADTLSRTAAQQINREKEEESFSPQPDNDKRHSEDEDATREEHSTIEEVAPPPLAEETKPKPLTPSEVNEMVLALFNDNNLRSAAAAQLKTGDEGTTHNLAMLLCRHLGKPEEEAERYETRLPDALEAWREELEVAA